MDYTICYGNPAIVASEVRILLSDGWILKGDLVTYSGGVCQALTLYKKPVKKAK